MRDITQLEDALRYGFYHVPLKNISNHNILTHLEYVTLYQSRNKFQEKGQAEVNWFGKNFDWKVLRRKEITERPTRRSTEEKLYVKFTIEKWLKRDKPDIPDGRGIYRLLYTYRNIYLIGHKNC